MFPRFDSSAEMYCAACFVPLGSWLWTHISPALGSWLENNTGEALSWGRNWVGENQLGYGAPRRVLLQPNPPYPIVVAEDTLSKILRMLEDDKSKVVGIYGPGGVGKTTLLKRLKNDLSQTRFGAFDVVIFVTVTDDVRINRIQKEIAEQLRLVSLDTIDMATKLSNALVEKKFLLLLDDLWEKLDLGIVGIPFLSRGEKGSKVAFTTRFTDVCNEMGAARWKVKVPYLSTESSWELFCQSLGKKEEDEWTESRRSLAKQVAEKCGGLPLALITMGTAMASATTDAEWEEALKTLKGTAAELGDMNQVLTLLKFSFDRVKEERHKECLLYCALYPEDYDIEVDELIEYWVGEGFFEGEGYPLSGLKNARRFGLRAITALKDACLLEDGKKNGKQVKLHSVVREMALWITRYSGAMESVLREENGEEISIMPQRWKDATRIWVRRHSGSKLLKMPRYENLRALFHLNLGHIPAGFFRSMPLLRVLDLSFTKIKHLPPEISSLVELRYLDLSHSSLESLPKEVGELANLRILNLAGTSRLKDIPTEAILSRSCLQSLNLFGSSISVSIRRTNNDSVCLNDLKGLKHLEEVGLTLGVFYQEDLHALLNFHALFAKMRYLALEDFRSFSSFDLSDVLGATKALEKLTIRNCLSLTQLIFPIDKRTNIEQLDLNEIPLATFSFKDSNTLVTRPIKVVTFENLRVLRIAYCEALLEIGWIKELPQLEDLELRHCPNMVEIIAVEESMVTGMDSLFPNLSEITLMGMGNLESICRQPLLFPSLKFVTVFDCVELRKLPFRHDSAKNIVHILCSSEWKDRLDWDHEDIRLRFNPYFYYSGAAEEEEEEEDIDESLT